MSTTPPKILVAEDNPGFARVLRLKLTEAGFDVAIADNGCDAWELAQQDQFDLVIADYKMPNMTGTDLCRHLRQHEHYAETPFFLLTAFCNDLDTERLREELQLQVLSKPISPSMLTSVISEFLTKSLDQYLPETQGQD